MMKIIFFEELFSRGIGILGVCIPLLGGLNCPRLLNNMFSRSSDSVSAITTAWITPIKDLTHKRPLAEVLWFEPPAFLMWLMNANRPKKTSSAVSNELLTVSLKIFATAFPLDFLRKAANQSTKNVSGRYFLQENGMFFFLS